MLNDKASIDAMTRAIQAAIIPAIEGGRAEVVMPAMIQVTISLAMFLNDCDAREAVESIIATLGDAKRFGSN